MKKILIGAAGGSPSTNFIRSLRMMKEAVFIVGVDCDEYTLQRSEADRNYFVPKANDPSYLDVINSITDEHDIEFLYSQNDQEIEVLSESREKVHAKQFLPKHQTVEICQNKFLSYTCWKEAGIKVPTSRLITNEQDLNESFQQFGPKIWVRDIKGAAGKGSFMTERLEDAKRWIDFQQGWGHFTAAEYLSPQSVTWSSIWYEGKLIVAQSRKRLYWELSNRSPSGITGITGTGVTFSDSTFDDLAIATILAVDSAPHGIFSVDMTLDQTGVPNPTEINIGRFFTTHYFFSRAGLNMPEIFLRLAFHEDFPSPHRITNPLSDNLLWIRGVDFLPILTDLQAVNFSKEELENRLRQLKQT